MGSELVAGIDGARFGWVACVTTTSGGSLRFATGATLADVWDTSWSVVAIDVPMGLPARDRRPADAEARSILGPRRSSLFPTPVHATLGAGDYADALARSRAACGRGLSRQSFHLLPGVRELRTWLGGPRDHVYEVHPETSFTLLNGGTALEPKTTAFGRAQRHHLVANWRPVELDQQLSIDHLDAAAAAWSATRIAAGTHHILGRDGVDPDGFSLTMAV
ncbi:MAG: DUF429 domain-containing protein [Acidimicrobiales bacterium]